MTTARKNVAKPAEPLNGNGEPSTVDISEITEESMGDPEGMTFAEILQLTTEVEKKLNEANIAFGQISSQLVEADGKLKQAQGLHDNISGEYHRRGQAVATLGTVLDLLKSFMPKKESDGQG